MKVARELTLATQDSYAINSYAWLPSTKLQFFCKILKKSEISLEINIVSRVNLPINYQHSLPYNAPLWGHKTSDI